MANYAFNLKSNLGDGLSFSSLEASEELGRLFELRLTCLHDDFDVDLESLLGSSMTVGCADDGRVVRWFNGIVAEISQDGDGGVDQSRHVAYQVTLVPRPWLSTHRVNCRIFSGRSVPEIVSGVLAEVGYTDIEKHLSGTYPKREYCVQYNEDDFFFVSRLMEQEGIYYYFVHHDGRHVMVLADGLGAHKRTEPYEQSYQPESHLRGGGAGVVTSFGHARRVHSRLHRSTDYDPQKPRLDLMADGATQLRHEAGELESFSWPGGHQSVSEGSRYAQVVAEARHAINARQQGQANSLQLATGALFRLKGFMQGDRNGEYLITSTRIALKQTGRASGGSADDGPPVRCDFTALDGNLSYRSPARTPRPLIAGLQTAKVVGKSDEDIEVDSQGRIQVAFHWIHGSTTEQDDRSCPVRVASSWAGKGWGVQSIPRVGQEVVVSFLDGDPDRPLVIGSVYNGDNPLPYTLPDNRTQSGIRSRSLKGTGDDFNEIRFEDKRGEEDLFVHAQKDMHEEVENDHVMQIDHDQATTVNNDQTLTVKHDRTETVDNDRKTTIKHDDTLDVTNNATTTVGQKFKLDAGSEIELVTGASSIVMKSSGEIQIKGINITINGDQAIKAEGGVQVNIQAGATMDVGAGASLKVHSDALLSLEGGATSTLKSPVTTVKGDAITQISAALITIG
ncbi:type VI secretion system tip protein TssI/VgrG [Pseudoxanthomonas sp.]|uniref:type VI secretion system Vgr family protein n=1 Tax=Pseudoxanthomonas sp. TaxID=1871049 RepID=UPI00261DC02E|nr:type VI secretion system tip protein TssI/VgrG [Pseudoxanthomonas sp.]WDS37808.1 MAG: type VI secretion system tip protein TssI/VgrG [Pseudoxanthomonas sp.]